MQAQETAAYGPGDYIPPVRSVYWAMRIMAGLGTLVFLVAAVGAFLFWRGRLERTRWFLWTAGRHDRRAVPGRARRWVLTEVGRQPWIVFGLLRTSDAASPNVSTTMLGVSIGVFVTLYLALGVVDFVLMRHYARLDPAEPDETPRQELPLADELLMTLQIFWFCLIAVLWGGYFVLEGFDFGVGMLQTVVPRSERDRDVLFETIGPHWDGNETWLVVAGSATFAAFPAWYATMFSGLLPCPAARARAADRASGLLEWREKGEPALAERLAGGEHRREFGCAARLGDRPRRPALRHADRLRRRLHGERARPLQRLHGRRGGRPLYCSSPSTARSS